MLIAKHAAWKTSFRGAGINPSCRPRSPEVKNSTCTMSVPKNFGLIKTAQGEAIVSEIPYPKLRDDYIIIKTVAVALNPTDWQNIDEPFKADQKWTLTGCDAAGTVIEIGKDVAKSFQIGDRVAGVGHGGKYLMYKSTMMSANNCR